MIWKRSFGANQDGVRSSRDRQSVWDFMMLRRGVKRWRQREVVQMDPIILSDELSRPENMGGFDDLAPKYKALYTKYHKQLGFTKVTMADIIQMGSTIGAVVCPLGPRVRSWVGRKDSSKPAPTGLLPSAYAEADYLIELFGNKTISAKGLVALLGAHSVSQQFVIDKPRAGDPQDSTPGVLDVLYYQQMTGSVKTPKRVYQFQSDVNLAQHDSTRSDFTAYGAQHGGQSSWGWDYAREYIRMSLLGVDNINELTECTKALPRTTTQWELKAKDKKKTDEWLNLDGVSDRVKKMGQHFHNGHF